jgi:hypothetical protein
LAEGAQQGVDCLNVLVDQVGMELCHAQRLELGVVACGGKVL